MRLAVLKAWFALYKLLTVALATKHKIGGANISGKDQNNFKTDFFFAIKLRNHD